MSSHIPTFVYWIQTIKNNGKLTWQTVSSSRMNKIKHWYWSMCFAFQYFISIFVFQLYSHEAFDKTVESELRNYKHQSASWKLEIRLGCGVTFDLRLPWSCLQTCAQTESVFKVYNNHKSFGCCLQPRWYLTPKARAFWNLSNPGGRNPPTPCNAVWRSMMIEFDSVILHYKLYPAI